MTTRKTEEAVIAEGGDPFADGLKAIEAFRRERCSSGGPEFEEGVEFVGPVIHPKSKDL